MRSLFELLTTDESKARVLLQCGTHRAFLSAFFDLKRELRKDYSYSMFALAAGVAKSLPRDIVEGDRRLTEKTLPKFLDAMELPPLMEEFFLTLYKNENIQDQSEYLEKLRQTYVELHFQRPFTDKNFSEFLVPFVYAASGSLDRGSLIGEISTRTGLNRTLVHSTLEKLAQLRLGTYYTSDGRFIPAVSQVHIEAVKSFDSFKPFYLRCLDLQRTAFQDRFPSETDLFYNEVFSVSRGDLPRLKEELKKMIQTFVLKNESPEGEQVQVLNIGFFEQRFS